jgi:Caspase domain
MAKKDWNPNNTKVLILGLGLSDWDDPEDPVGHRDAVLHTFFKKAGIPDAQNVHFRDDEGDRDSLLAFLPDFLADSDEDTLFIFHYSGHGDVVADTSLEYDLYFCHPESDSLTLQDLYESIEDNFNGYHVLLMADCCHSGNIARFAATIDSEYYYAGLASALAENTSTGAWTFTDCILEAFRGNAMLDTDENNTISLRELAQYAKQEMREQESQKSDFGHSCDFDIGLRLAIVKS